MIPVWTIKLGAGLALLMAVAGYGYHHGAQRVQAKWDAQAQAAKDAVDTARESERLRARAADSDYQARRAAADRRSTQPSPDAAYALHATICPPAGALGKALELGDVPVGAAVLQRLRDAGADY